MTTTAVDSRAQRTLSKRESILFTADFTQSLQPTEKITSVTSVAESTSLGLTVGSGTANTAATIDCDGRTIAVGKAVQFRVSAANAEEGDAVVSVVVATDASNTRAMNCRLKVVA